MLSGRGLRAHCPSVYAPRAPTGSCSLLVSEPCLPPICHPTAGICMLSRLAPFPPLLGATEPAGSTQLQPLGAARGGSLLWALLKSRLGSRSVFLPAGSDEAMALPGWPLEETVPRRTLSTGSSLPFEGQFWPGSSNATSQSLLVWAAGSPKGNKQPQRPTRQNRELPPKLLCDFSP